VGEPSTGIVRVADGSNRSLYDVSICSRHRLGHGLRGQQARRARALLAHALRDGHRHVLAGSGQLAHVLRELVPLAGRELVGVDAGQIDVRARSVRRRSAPATRHQQGHQGNA
jgi:hypothetical protein